VEKRQVLSHHEVLTRLDGYDPERGVKVVGHRGYFLKKWGVFLNQAMINYGLEFLSQRDYIPLQTPQFMLKDYMAKTAQLEQFDEELYKVIDGEPQNDKYLIATSEQPISAFHADEWLLARDLPIKYAFIEKLPSKTNSVCIDMLALVPVIEGRPGLTVVMLGEFSGFINLKRYEILPEAPLWLHSDFTG
jgi:hypothetical protein